MSLAPELFHDPAGVDLLTAFDVDRHATVVGGCWPNRSTEVVEFRGAWSARCADCGSTVRAGSLDGLLDSMEGHAPGWATEGTVTGRSYR